MIELLEHYSLSDILIFTVFLALAVKSLNMFFEWGWQQLRILFDKEHNKLNEKEKLQQRLKEGSQIMKTLQDNQKIIEDQLAELQQKIDMLIDSDKDDIKSYITREHHYFCYRAGWIDDFSLDCLEKRYTHYEEEGGNSFIAHFMEELRALPNQQPPLED